MNIRSLLGPLLNFGGTSKVHVWQRFEPIGEGIAGTMSDSTRHVTKSLATPWA